MSERRACRTLGQHRSTQRKVPQGRADEQLLTDDIIELADKYGRYGYYNIKTDRVHMPPIGTFYRAAGYFGTLAHETIHNAEVRIMPRRFSQPVAQWEIRRGISA